MNDEWITTKQAIKISGFHPDYLRTQIRAGRILAEKFSTVWRINRKSLESYIEEQNKKGNRRGRKPTKKP